MFEQVEEQVRSSVERLRFAVEALGARVIAAGVLVVAVALVRHLVSQRGSSFLPIRLAFARYLTLALELQLAADILSTSVAPTWERIGKLAAIAINRPAPRTAAGAGAHRHRAAGAHRHRAAGAGAGGSGDPAAPSVRLAGLRRLPGLPRSRPCGQQDPHPDPCPARGRAAVVQLSFEALGPGFASAGVAMVLTTVVMVVFDVAHLIARRAK